MCLPKHAVWACFGPVRDRNSSVSRPFPRHQVSEICPCVPPTPVPGTRKQPRKGPSPVPLSPCSPQVSYSRKACPHPDSVTASEFSKTSKPSVTEPFVYANPAQPVSSPVERGTLGSLRPESPDSPRPWPGAFHCRALALGGLLALPTLKLLPFDPPQPRGRTDPGCPGQSHLKDELFSFLPLPPHTPFRERACQWKLPD